MRATIYYFSSTGNSLAIANRIAQGLGDCDVRSMAAGSPKAPAGGPGHALGFVFPVYYSGLPRLVKRFVRSLDIPKDTYCFAYTTYGGTDADTLGMLDDILKEKGARLSFGAGARMPGNYIIEYQAFSERSIQRLIGKALASADEAAAKIARRDSQPVRRKLRWISRRISSKLMDTRIREWDEAFRATDKCTGCGLCSRICPAGNIRIIRDRPLWQHHCEHCVACIQWCPAEAIEYGSKTIGRKRYRYPGLPAAAIVAGSPQATDIETEQTHA